MIHSTEFLVVLTKTASGDKFIVSVSDYECDDSDYKCSCEVLM